MKKLIEIFEGIQEKKLSKHEETIKNNLIEDHFDLLLELYNEDSLLLEEKHQLLTWDNNYDIIIKFAPIINDLLGTESNKSISVQRLESIVAVEKENEVLL